jgi:intein/homing endonuclease
MKKWRKGYYMDEYLAINLMGIPKYLAAAWDVVGIVSRHGKVRIGKTLSNDSKIKLVDETGKIYNSKPLGEYKDGEILNTLTYDFTQKKFVKTHGEIIKEYDEKEFFKMKLKNGKEITCSVNHKFFVRRGKKIIGLPLKEINPGDKILCRKEVKKQ